MAEFSKAGSLGSGALVIGASASESDHDVPFVAATIEPAPNLPRIWGELLTLLQRDDFGSPVVALVLESLTPAVAAAVQQTAQQIRDEISHWSAASEQLRRLAQSTLADVGPESQRVLVKLEQAHRQAARVIEVLEALSTTPAMRLAADAPQKLPDAAAIANVSEVFAASPFKWKDLHEADPFRVNLDELPVIVQEPRTTTHRTVPDRGPSNFERAEKLYREATDCWEKNDLLAADRLYTQALELDRTFMWAYLHRGRVRLLKGRTDDAVEDLTDALRLSGGDAHAYWWRGDANLICGRMEEAVDDYNQCLELCPDLFLARYNRAVAFREKGELDRALSELEDLVQVQPAHGPLYLNRGLIYLSRGNVARASVEFRKAVRYQPQSREAAQRLAQADALLEEQRLATTKKQASAARSNSHALRLPQPAEESDLPFALPRRADVLSSRAEATASREREHHGAAKPIHRTRINSSPSPVQELTADDDDPESVFSDLLRDEEPSSPVPAACFIDTVPMIPIGESDTGLRGTEHGAPTDYALRFRCPHCHKNSSVRWDKLQRGKVLSCPNCRKTFTTRLDGNLVEVTKDKQGHWVNEEERQERLHEVRTTRRRLIAGCGAALVAVIAMTCSPKIVRSWSPPPEAELPRELEPRIQAFAQAWLNGDIRTMRRLTDPVQDRQLFGWCKRNPPPASYNPQGVDRDLRLRMEVVWNQHPLRLVKICFDGLPASGGESSLQLQLVWEERGGQWIFQPNPNFQTQR